MVFFVSLSDWTAKAIAEGSLETSSPEEPKPKSLPGLRALPKESWPTVIPMSEWSQLSGGQGVAGIQPGLTPGISPYQINPITAVMTAGVVLAIQSLKEQGRIDHQALWRLLNTTDFYAGIAGAFAATKTKDAVVAGGRGLASRIAPGAFKEFGKNHTVQLFGNIMNAFSYTLAVSSGFEYFSQFWKLATRDIPNVSRVSDLTGASSTDVIRVLSNLMQYAVHPDVQRRILSSVKYHRIYTFEFIAMNVGLFVGVFVGDQVAKRIGPKASEATKKAWSQRLTLEMGRFLGGVLGGAAVQFIPDGFRLRVNASLLDSKIHALRGDMNHLITKIEQGVLNKSYPPYSAPSIGSFFSPQVNLQSDVMRMIRKRDLLYSLYAHRYFLIGVEDTMMEEIQQEQVALNQKIEFWIMQSGGAGPSSSLEALDRSLAAPMELQALENYIYQDIHRDEYQRHYGRVLFAGMQNLSRSYEDFEDFLISLHEFQQDEGVEILRDLPATP